MDEFIQVVTTVGSEEDAKRIARELVEKRLAACVQVAGPISSTYRWEGAVETETEWLCLIKSRGELYEDLECAIRESHPYDVPEILAMPVTAGNGTYLDWMRQVTAR